MWSFKRDAYRTENVNILSNYFTLNYGDTCVSACTVTPSGGTGQVFVNNVDTFGSVDDVQVNSISIFVSSGAFPVLGGENAQGSYGGEISGLSTVGIFITVSTSAPVNLSLNTGYTDCIVTPGYVEFTGVNLSTNANITISLNPQGSSCI